MKSTTLNTPAPRVPKREVSGGKPHSPWHLYYNVPLAVRLERLDAVLPSDDFCGEEAVAALRQLLDTSVETLWNADLYSSDESEVELATDLYDALDRAYEALDPGCSVWLCDPSFEPLSYQCSYREVLRLVYNLRQKYLRERKKDSLYLDLAHGILRNVAVRLLTLPDVSAAPSPAPKAPHSDPDSGVSLRTRLAGANPDYSGDLNQLIRSHPQSRWNDIVKDHVPWQQYPVLALPVSHYFYAAARINRSADPVQTAREDFNGFLDSDKEIFSFAILLMIAMNKFPKKDPMAAYAPPDDAFLYDLLVKPIFPDPRPRSGENKK